MATPASTSPNEVYIFLGSSHFPAESNTDLSILKPGVAGILRNGESLTMLRADLDALPLEVNRVYHMPALGLAEIKTG